MKTIGLLGGMSWESSIVYEQMVVGATGGVGALALVVAGILVMRRQKC